MIIPSDTLFLIVHTLSLSLTRTYTYIYIAYNVCMKICYSGLHVP